MNLQVSNSAIGRLRMAGIAEGISFILDKSLRKEERNLETQKIV